MDFTSNSEGGLGNVIIFGTSLFAMSIMTTSILSSYNNTQNVLGNQIHNLILKKYDKKITDENSEQFNSDINNLLQQKSNYSILYNTFATGIIGSFIYVATVSYKKLHL